jgi:hypothetical protein
MGHYMFFEPQNGRNGRRHVCDKCGRHRLEEFMEKINEWHQGQWICKLGGCKFKY